MDTQCYTPVEIDDTDRTPDEIMERAADIIDEKGWCVGSLYESGTGRVCVLGALRLAGNLKTGGQTFSVYSPTLKNTINYIQSHLGEVITNWNDLICRDRYTATEMLRVEAKRYRERVQHG
jgi:hypothetical protein